MGYHSSPTVTALMTIFNVRLGWWLGNPAYGKWRKPGPGMGPYLIDELFGRTDSRQGTMSTSPTAAISRTSASTS